jgi:type I restriction enzyme S subunit
MTKQGKYVEYTEKHISEKGLNNSSAWLVPKNSLILSMYASVGLVCINTVPLSTSQAMFSMILKDSENLDYIYYYLNYFRETQIHRLLETGTQSNINADTVKAIKIPFYANQSAYVKSMLAIEKRLNNEKEMLSALQREKAFLLKSMFI